MSWGEGIPRRSGGWIPIISTVRLPSISTRSLTRGFTLLEVLLSIAIIALLASVLVGGAAHLMTDQPITAGEVFWKSVQEARKTALKTEHDIRLKFDREKKAFYLVDGQAPAVADERGVKEEVRLKTFAVPAATAGDLTVDFLDASVKGGNTILIAGVLIEAKTIPHVTFYSDGTCQAFRAQFMRGGASSILAIDPWTCAPVLLPPDPNAPASF
jgi:general secretion pathway protein H